MSRSSPWFALAALVLSACQREGGAAAPQAQALRNLGLACDALVGSGELWLVTVREAEQGGVDANGDGDARDLVLHVLDLEREALVATGLALASDGDAPPLLACDGNALAFAVDEAAQGGIDRNGDGDALDRVLCVYERANGTVRNLALAVRTIQVGGTLVAVAVDEHGQGASDLDGDGDADGTVLSVHDLADGSNTTFALRDSAPLAVHAGYVALKLSERAGLDLTLDGDDTDTQVLEIYDAALRRLHNTTLALAAPVVAAAGGTFGFSVSEAAQGRGDLSGDGDADDAVFHAYDPARGFSVNLRLVVPFQPAPASDGERYLLHAREAPSARDWNGDGDLEDLVVHVFEPLTGLLYSTGLASQGSAVLLGGWVAVSVSETMQGLGDLDRDGTTDGNLVHVMELASGDVRALELDAFALFASERRLFLAPLEELAPADWNGDGDQLDRVLFGWGAPELRARSSGSAVAAVLAAAGDHALVSVREGEHDGNGDGDRDDLLLELHDGLGGRSRALGLAVGSAARLTPRLAVVALVEELAQGQDANGDGDLADEVLFLVAPPR